MMDLFENKIAPPLMKISANKRLMAIRNGLSLTIPFTIIGSIFLIIGNLPIQAWMDFISPYSGYLNATVNVTFGILGLISTMGIGFYLAKEFDVEPISNAMITTIAFLLGTVNAEFSIEIGNLGATGMFTGIVIGLLTIEIHSFFVKRGITIKMPDGVPPAVSSSFTSLIPAFAVIVLVWVVRVILNVDLNQVIQTVFSPLVVGLDSLAGITIYALLACLLWTVGIHGDNALSGIATPIFLANLAANTQAFQTGDSLPHIVVDGFWIIYMCLGGTGATMGLVINMLFSKSKRYKSLGKLSLPSAIFAINEPVIFGFPIVMNPLLMIPFILTPVLFGAVAYVLTNVGILAPIVFQVPWTTPPVIGAYLATNGDINAAIFQGLLVVFSFLIYRPFFKLAERKELELEVNSEKEVIVEKVIS